MVKKEGLMRGSAAWNSCQSRFYQQYQLKSGLTKARKQEDKGVQGVLPFLNITFSLQTWYILYPERSSSPGVFQGQSPVLCL